MPARPRPATGSQLPLKTCTEAWATAGVNSVDTDTHQRLRYLVSRNVDEDRHSAGATKVTKVYSGGMCRDAPGRLE